MSKIKFCLDVIEPKKFSSDLIDSNYMFDVRGYTTPIFVIYVENNKKSIEKFLKFLQTHYDPDCTHADLFEYQMRI